LCHGTVCVVGKIRDLILQLSKSSIYSTKPIDDGDIKRYSVHKNMLQTETYAKLSLLSEAVKNNANIEVIDVAVTPKYKMRLVLVLCGLMGVIFSITGLLCRRALTEYRFEKKTMNDRA
ncbi:GNVR domain-containing protein, partial [Salmonella enterica]